MNSFMAPRIIAAVFLFALLYACGGAKKLAIEPALEGNNAEVILAEMEKSELDFETFSAKAAVTITQDKKITSFKTNLRIKADSAIWISITPLFGIEMARVLITEDTVKVIDRMDKKYFVGDFEYINKKFNLDMEFSTLQALLIGNMINFEVDDDLRVSRDKNLYYLGNLKKRKAKKVEENPQKIIRKSNEQLSFWIDPTIYKLTEVILTDLSADRFVQGKYLDYKQYNSQWIPEQLNYSIQSETPSSINISYSRIELDQEMNFPFNIPSKYEKVHY